MRATSAPIERARRAVRSRPRCRSPARGRARRGRRRERSARRPDPQHRHPRGRRPAAGARRRLVRDGAAQPGHGAGPPRHVRRLHRAAAGDRRARLRRRLSDADPSDRHDQPQGQEQFAEGRPGRSRQPLRHRKLAGRPRRGASRARHARRFPPLRRCLPRPRHGGGARLRHPVLARSSVAQAASGLVQAAARRLDPLRRESAEEIRGHRQSGFLLRRPHRAVAGAARRHPVLGASRASASSASTIRTPSRFRSGNG